MLVTESGITISVKLVQLANASSPILVTLSGIIIFFKLLQPANAYLPIHLTLSGITISVKPLQPTNAYSSILVTLSGITISVKLLQPLNAYQAILVTPSGIVNNVAVLPTAYCINVFPSLLYKCPSIDLYAVLFSSTEISVKLSQEKNAQLPILVTVPGITTFVKILHPEKVSSLILVTALPLYTDGITTCVSVPV